MDARTSVSEISTNDSFISWFKARGGSVHSGVGITSFPSMGRGAIALEDIKKDIVLFTLPRSLTLSMRTSSLPSKFGEREWKKYQLHKGWVGLILCMLWEDQAGEKGYWGGYISSLPDQFQTPMFWNDEEIEELRGTSIFDKIGRVEAEKDYFDKLLPAVKNRSDIFPTEELEVHYSLQRYHIMGSRILSRSFHVERWGGEGEENDDDQRLETIKQDEMDVDTSDRDHTEEGKDDEVEDDEETDEEDIEDPLDVAMVPFADILNARYRSENAKLCYHCKDLQMICTRDIQSGEQIWNTYGDPPNSDLLRRYGHIDSISEDSGVQGNPADVVDIRADAVLNVLRLETNDNEFLLERIEWWLEEGGDDMFTLETNFALPDELISLIRLLLMPKVEWELTRDKGKVPKPKAGVDILRIAKTVLQKRLEDYKTSLEEDEMFLEAAEVNTNKYMATVVRVGEKRILMGAIGEVMKRLTRVGRENKKRPMDGDGTSRSNKRVKA